MSEMLVGIIATLAISSIFQIIFLIAYVRKLRIDHDKLSEHVYDMYDTAELYHDSQDIEIRVFGLEKRIEKLTCKDQKHREKRVNELEKFVIEFKKHLVDNLKTKYMSATMEKVIIKAGPMYVSAFSDKEIRLNGAMENAKHFSSIEEVGQVFNVLKEIGYTVWIKKI